MIMGCGFSRSQIVPMVTEAGASQNASATSSRKKHRPKHGSMCGQCGLEGHVKVGTWWCDDCHIYICNYCAWNHSNDLDTISHFLLQADTLPTPKSPKPAWQTRKQTQSKQAILKCYFDTRSALHYVDVANYGEWNQQDGHEYKRGSCLLPQLNMCLCRKRYVNEAVSVISACTYTNGGYIAVTDYLNEEVKLFDSNFNCTSYIKLEDNKPTDICAHGSELYVTMEGKCEIYKLGVSLPLFCLGRKLSIKSIFKTEGNCDSIAVYKKSYFYHGLVVGKTFTSVYHTKKYQVHIMDFKGNIEQTLYYDSKGKSLFKGKVYVSGTPNIGEIIISDKAGNTVQGFNVVNEGEITFKQTVKDPLGVCVDSEDNVYVICHHCFYWIPPHRESVMPFLKRGHRSRATNCGINKITNTLAITSSHSETVQLYNIVGVSEDYQGV